METERRILDSISLWSAASVAGMLTANALQIPCEQPRPILFYQDYGHPEPERTPQPQQENRTIAFSSSSAMSSIEPGMFTISGNPPKDFTLTWINHEGEKIVFDAAVPLEITSKSA